MVLTMLPAMSVPAAAAGEDCTGDHSGWTELSGNKELKSLSGNCVLTDDVIVTGTSSGNIEIKSAVTLCLNGYTLNLNGSNSFRIYENGSLTLCDCTGRGKITNSQSTVVAGVYMEGGSFTMNGGSIAGIGGGAVQVNSGASFIMNGGSITDNHLNVTKDANYAPCGGVLVNSGSFIMTDGSITGNTVEVEGGLSVSGGVLVCNGGSFTMTGGEITNNHCTVESFLPTSGIAGGVCVGSAFMGTGTFTVSGDVTIAGNTFNGSAKNVWLYNSQKINIGSGGLTGGEIGVTRDTPDVFTTGGGASYRQHFFSDNDAYVVVPSGGELALGTVADNPHRHYVCGDAICADSHAEATYTPKSDFGGSLGAGSYHLTRSVTATDDITISGAVNLCLNGKTIDLDGHHFIINSGGSLTICDCMGGGQITGGQAEQGGAVLVNGGGSLTLHSGAIAGNTASGGGDGSGGSNRAGGGAVCVNGGSFTMTGGAIENNTASVTKKNDGGGGVLLNSGTFEMTGGSITGNDVTGHANSVGGGVHINGGTFTMTNGTISDNSAINGGGVTVFKGTEGESSFALSGGSITGNTVTEIGGGIYVLPGTTFHLSGASAISGNTAGSADSNIYLSSSTITLSDTLSNTTPYGVSMASPDVFTSGGGAAYIENFTSDDSKYKVTAKDGELCLTSGYTVTFDLGGAAGTAPTNQEVDQGGKATKPTTDPTWDGHTFAGWYNGGTLWNFDTVVTANMTLTAKWITDPTVTVSGDTSLTYGTGGTLTANVTNEVSGHNYAYQWYCNGSTINGATGSSYTVAADTAVGTYTYYCTITASITGSSVTADAASSDVTVTVRQKGYESGSFTISSIPDQTYTGSQIRPDVTVKFGGTTLAKGTDYDLEYGTNTAAGTDTGSVTVKFKGNYSGEATVYFDIVYAPFPGGTTNDTVFEDYTDTSSNWSNSEDGVTFTPQDGWTVSTSPDGDYKESVTFDDEQDGEHTETVYVKDSSGNIYETEITYKLDKTAPQVSGLTADHTQWTADDVTISFTASDATSGIDSVTVSKDGGTAQTVTGSGSDYSFPADSNGTYTVTVTDKAGNTTTQAITISNIDKTEPGLTVSGGDMGAASLTLKAEAKQNGGSPVTVTAKDSSGNVLTANGDGSYTVTKPGKYTFTAATGAGQTTVETRTVYSITFDSNGGSSVDRQLVVSGGKVTQPADPTRIGYTFDCWLRGGTDWDLGSQVTTNLALTANWTLDAPAVELTASKNNVTYGESITLTATASHAAGENIDFTYQWYKDGKPLNSISDTTSFLTLTDVDESGSYTVKVTAEDKDGLTAAAEDTVTVAIGKATPVLSVDGVAITYGDTLKDNLLKGTASNGSETVSGSFAWGNDKPGANPTVAQSGNYTVVFTPNDKANYTDATTTITLTVNRKELTPAVASVDDKIYDGNASTTGTITLSGEVLDETPTASGVFTFEDKNAGDNKSVNVAVTLDGEWGDNYVLSTDELTARADITPKTVGLTWDGYKNLVYNGQPVNVAAKATELVEGDQCAVIVKDGSKTNAGGYTAEATGLDNPNYQLPDSGTTQSYTIAPRPVELSWDYTEPFTYDKGEKTVTATIDNLAPDDECELTYRNNKKTDAGSYKAEVATLGNPNYTLTGGKNLSLDWTINKAVISFTVAGNSHTYDNTAKTASVTQTESEPTKIDADKYTVTYGGENSQTEAGTYDITVAISDPNFCFAGGAASAKVGELTIAPKQAVVTWQNLNQVYGDGQQVRVLIDGLADGDSAENAIITGGGTAAGSYPLCVTLANYRLSNDTATLVIQKKPVVVTVTDNAVTPGGEPTINVPGLTEGKDYTVTYKDKDGNVVENPTQSGTYEVWVKFPEDSNYRHPDGSSDKQVGSFTITETQPVLYTVTFDGNGNTSGTMTALELTGGSTQTLPDCGYTKTKYQFTGWLYGGKTYKPGDSFTTPYGDVTFTAQWQAVFEVSGTIKEETGSGKQDTENAVVSLWLGANKIAETHTEADGTYSFDDLLPGIYNLVVSKDQRTVTSMVEITTTDRTCNAILPQYVTNSVVDVTPGSPDIVVGKLDTGFTEDDLSTAETGGKVEITFKADEQQEDDIEKDVLKDLQSAGGSNLALFLDCTLTKTVTDETGTSTSELTQSSVVLEILLPLPTELQGKYNYTISRMHGGEAQIVPQGESSKNEDGEYFTVSEDKTVLTLHVKNFSTYAVGYRNAPSTPTYPPVKNESENGSYTVSPSNPSNGQNVTITPKPDEGYVVDSVTVTDKTGKDVTVTPNTDGAYTFTQPNGSVTITVTFRKDTGLSDCPRDESCPMAKFSDADRNAWYHDGVHYCVENGLMQGYGNGIFGPNDTLSRAMLVQILYNLENRPAVSGESVFSDVAHSAWYADAVNWAAANGIVEGFGNGQYGPEDDITREQLAAILYRYAQYKNYDVSVGEDTNILSYSDAPEVSEYAVPAMQWACGAGIMEGYGDVLDPTGNATRAQAATMLMRFGAI